MAPDLPVHDRRGTSQRPGDRPHPQPSGDLLPLGGAERPRGLLAGALRDSAGLPEPGVYRPERATQRRSDVD